MLVDAKNDARCPETKPAPISRPESKPSPPRVSRRLRVPRRNCGAPSEEPEEDWVSASWEIAHTSAEVSSVDMSSGHRKARPLRLTSSRARTENLLKGSSSKSAISRSPSMSARSSSARRQEDSPRELPGGALAATIKRTRSSSLSRRATRGWTSPRWASFLRSASKGARTSSLTPWRRSRTGAHLAAQAAMWLTTKRQSAIAALTARTNSETRTAPLEEEEPEPPPPALPELELPVLTGGACASASRSLASRPRTRPAKKSESMQVGKPSVLEATMAFTSLAYRRILELTFFSAVAPSSFAAFRREHR
mmetsp:Transcript_67912/g.153674  ORF Transcript_67912/g.153674 Transcript_67912/m.153674 type:complete len:309 (-) Transcript_67912:290-1216(-)